MPALQIIALDTATPQLRAPASGDTYLAPRAIAITPEALTGSAASSSLDIAQTWNTTGTPTAIKLNVTDTASNANSLLLDLQTGGTSRFRVEKSGRTHITENAYITASIAFQSSTSQIAWNDLVVIRDAADTFAQRRGSAAQTFRIYNTTDSGLTNFERGFVGWSSNTLRIGTEKGGTGSARPIAFLVDGTEGAILDTSRNLGVGISLPQSRLHLHDVSGGGDVPRLRFTNGGTGTAATDGMFFGVSNTNQFDIWNFENAPIRFGTNNVIRGVFDGAGSFILGNAGLATNATDGFIYIRGCAGLPTGTPTAATDRVPLVVDTTNHKLYFYSGGQWRDAGP